MELHAVRNPDGYVNAVLRVRWSFKQALIDQIEQQGFSLDKMSLLITVRALVSTGFEGFESTEQVETKRWLVRPKDRTAYISFSRPGRSQIYATLVEISNESDHKVVREQQRAEHRVLNERGQLIDGRVRHINIGALLEVEVLPEMFAPPPPAFLQRIAMLFSESRPYDQCHFRRRLIVNFFIVIPLLLTLGIAFRLVILAGALALGLRGIIWRGMLPFNLDDIPWSQGGRSVYLYNRQGYRRRQWWLGYLLNPTAILIAAYLFGRVLRLTWWLALVYGAGSIGLAVGIIVLVGWALTLLFSPAREGAAARYERRRRDEEERHQQQIAELSGAADDVQEGRFTMFYRETKARICLPYARR
jgi:hypothetical protein